jgi:GST-like protein
MIDVYSWTTGNARKVYIMLEETGLAYTAHPVNIGKGDQFKPEFLKISPNNKIPAIVDQDGPGGTPYSMFESGAILMYLADKTGQLMPADPVGRYQTIQWSMFQMGDVGPIFGQAGHYVDKTRGPEHAVAREHFVEDARRLMRVIDGRLSDNDYIVGPDFTIADILIWSWCREPEKRGLNADDHPNFKRWFATIAARPSIAAVDEVCEEIRAGRDARRDP